jgi:hypothetical protein
MLLTVMLLSRDSMGNIEVMKRGDIQLTSAGTGISHSEKTHGSKVRDQPLCTHETILSTPNIGSSFLADLDGSVYQQIDSKVFQSVRYSCPPLYLC